jgi:hypothetical protein
MLERLSMVMSCSGSARFLASEAVTHLKYDLLTHLKYDLLRVALRGISNMLQSARNLREVFGFHVLDCIHDETVDAGTAENVRG